MPGELPAYHPETVIRDWKNGENFSIADALTGVAVFGATGSGKTSGTGKHLAIGYLGSAAEMGGIVLCAKISEREQFIQWAKEAGRERDVIVFDASGQHRFNFLEWESSRASQGGGLTINVVALLEEIITALEPQKASGGGDEGQFWEDALHQLLSAAVELVQLAGYELSLTTMRDIVRSAPLSREQAKDEQWQKESACWHFLSEAERNTGGANDDVKADYIECRAYWLDDYANLSEKTRSIITLMFTKLAQPFSARPLRKLFSTDTTVTPEMTFDGKIIIIDLPTQEFRLAGRIAALVWKYCWQVAVMRRPPAAQGKFLRPVFCWADECTNFISRGDPEFQAVARASAGCTVFLNQNISQYRKRLGDNDAFESFIANLQTKVFHQSTGPTCRWAAELLGEEWKAITSTNVGRSNPQAIGAEPTSSAGVSRSEQRRYLVEPARFTTLKRGGPAYGHQVEAIVYKGGHLFSDGLPYTLLTFNQR